MRRNSQVVFIRSAMPSNALFCLMSLAIGVYIPFRQSQQDCRDGIGCIHIREATLTTLNYLVQLELQSGAIAHDHTSSSNLLYPLQCGP